MASKEIKNDTKRDELIDLIVDTINKTGDDGTAAFFLNDIDNPANIIDWISTGSSELDLRISNRPHGGVPVGRITMFNGLEQSGKSLVCGHILANTQKKGGHAILIDTEMSVSNQFLEAIGVDTERMAYIQVDTIEDVFETLAGIIEMIRKKDKDKLVCICVDSIAGASTKDEMESDFDIAGFATGKARILNKAMRKITTMIGKQKIAVVFTNQLRQKMNAGPFSDPYVSPGGMGANFHCSTIIRLQKRATITQTIKGNKTPIGVRVQATVTKNRMGPPLQKAEFDIFFDSGIDDYQSWIRTMKNYKIISGTGHGYTFVDSQGTTHKFKPDTIVDLCESHPNVRDEMYDRMCDALITVYKPALTRNPDDLEFSMGDDE